MASKRKRKLRSQPRVQGLRRLRVSLALHPDLYEKVLKDCYVDSVGKSFTCSNAIAFAYGFSQPTYADITQNDKWTRRQR